MIAVVDHNDPEIRRDHQQRIHPGKLTDVWKVSAGDQLGRSLEMCLGLLP